MRNTNTSTSGAAGLDDGRNIYLLNNTQHHGKNPPGCVKFNVKDNNKG